MQRRIWSGGLSIGLARVGFVPRGSVPSVVYLSAGFHQWFISCPGSIKSENGPRRDIQGCLLGLQYPTENRGLARNQHGRRACGRGFSARSGAATSSSGPHSIKSTRRFSVLCSTPSPAESGSGPRSSSRLSRVWPTSTAGARPSLRETGIAVVFTQAQHGRAVMVGRIREVGQNAPK
jgi:hypothetical protein